MLGRPAFACARAVVICPDDLVDKAFTPEDLIQKDLAVMHFAVINMEIQAAVGRQDPIGFFQARGDKGDEIVKFVRITAFAQDLCFITAALKSDSVAFLGANGADARARLVAAGVEGGSI